MKIIKLYDDKNINNKSSYTCDECGINLKEDNEIVVIELTNKKQMHITLCKKCVHKMNATLSRIPYSPHKKQSRNQEIIKLKNNGMNYSEIAKIHNVSPQRIRAICTSECNKISGDPIHELPSRFCNILRQRFHINSLYELPKQHFKEEQDAFYNIGPQFVIVLNNVCQKHGIDCSNLTQAFILSKKLRNAEIQYIMSQI